jgi:hypothetical protein
MQNVPAMGRFAFWLLSLEKDYLTFRKKEKKRGRFPF